MASEEKKLNNQETNKTNRSSDEQEHPQSTFINTPRQEPNMAATSDDDEEQRPSGDVDFGQLLDQFEQEQAALQEGEVVRGTVVGISERGVVIDFGYKSEGIVNPAEFTENGVLAVKAGDEVDVLVKNMETADGLPILSRADAVRMRAWDDLEVNSCFDFRAPVVTRLVRQSPAAHRVGSQCTRRNKHVSRC